MQLEKKNRDTGMAVKTGKIRGPQTRESKLFGTDVALLKSRAAPTN